LPKFHNPEYKIIKQPVQNRLGVDGNGNGDAVAVEALKSGLDVVDVLWRATLEVARLRRVVDAGVRRHGGQIQGGAQADAVKGHLINAVFFLRQGELPVCLGEQSSCLPASQPAPSAD
jgi:hypothetical protein